MNADTRRWNLTVAALIFVVVASVTYGVKSVEMKFQLEDDINRRFTVAEEVTPPKRIIDSAFRLTRTLRPTYPSPIILDFTYPPGERESWFLRDDSYHLAPDYRSYRGVTMLFDDERLLVAGRTFYR